MLGSRKTCPNCHDTNLKRVPVNRTIQCSGCKLILEERAVGDLSEVHVVTQTEEAHFVVPPDSLLTNIVDDNPRDPYCTPGFISVFRMLSPLREPLFTTSSRTYSGALAEMERLIGDALFAGYVGYNGRAPGGAPLKKEENVDGPERNKSGGDARHTLVAYFEIVELASILGVDKETINLAVRIFRHTASNTSLRNRNVECLATAAFVAAAERRWFEYEAWIKRNRKKAAHEHSSVHGTGSEIESLSKEQGSEAGRQHNGKLDYDAIQERTTDSMMLDEGITAEKVSMALAIDMDNTFDKDLSQKSTFTGITEKLTREDQMAVKQESIETAPVENTLQENQEASGATYPWPIPPRHLSIDEISSAANLDVNEVTRYLKVVRIALQKQRPDNSSSVTGHMPVFCHRLDLSAKTQKLAIGVAENAMRNNICSRRNPVSISAAAIYLACQMEGVRKTQIEICRATNLTEVTLRKVHKELSRELSAIIPGWYKAEKSAGERKLAFERSNAQQKQEEASVANSEDQKLGKTRASVGKEEPKTSLVVDQSDQHLPVPPPLPPGFGEQTSKPSSSDGKPPGPPSPPALPPLPEQSIQAASIAKPSNPLMAMMSDPASQTLAMQAFANAFSMMPQLMMPPPPPPLPPPQSENRNSAQNSLAEKQPEIEEKQKSLENKSGQSSASVTEKPKENPKSADISTRRVLNVPVPEGIRSELSTGESVRSPNAANSASTLSQDPQKVMAGMQSVLGMMQATFQMMQQGQSGQGGREKSLTGVNPWAAMASLIQPQHPSVDYVQKPESGNVKSGRDGDVSESVGRAPKSSISSEQKIAALASKSASESKPSES